MKICIFLEEHIHHMQNRVPEFVLLVPSFPFLSVICVGSARGLLPCPAVSSVNLLFADANVAPTAKRVHVLFSKGETFHSSSLSSYLYLYTTSPNHPTIPYQGAVIESGAIGGTCVNVGTCSLLATALQLLQLKRFVTFSC